MTDAELLEWICRRAGYYTIRYFPERKDLKYVVWDVGSGLVFAGSGITAQEAIINAIEYDKTKGLV